SGAPRSGPGSGPPPDTLDREPADHLAISVKGAAGEELVVQRNALSSIPQSFLAEPLAPQFSPRAGVARARPPIPLLPPGGDVQVALEWIPGQLRRHEDLQQTPHVRQRDAVGRFFPPTAAPPASGTTAPASPRSCDGASPTNCAPHRHPGPLP